MDDAIQTLMDWRTQALGHSVEVSLKSPSDRLRLQEKFYGAAKEAGISIEDDVDPKSKPDVQVTSAATSVTADQLDAWSNDVENHYPMTLLITRLKLKKDRKKMTAPQRDDL